MEDFKDTLKVVAMMVAFLTISLSLLVLFCIAFEEIRCKGYVNKTVVEIGGCGRSYCPVMYHDGTRDTITAPMVGDVVSVCVKR